MNKTATQNLTSLVVSALDELKAMNIRILDVTTLTSITDVMVIASGRTGRQVKALADKVLERLGEAGLQVLGTEGEREAEWILIDAGDAVVHIMQPVTRAYYQLEKLWDIDDAAKDSSSV